MLSEEARRAGTGNADSAERGPPSDHCQLGPAPTHPPQSHLAQWWGKWGGTLVGPQSQGSCEGGPRRGLRPFGLEISLLGWNFGAEVGEVRAEPFQGLTEC